MGAGGTSVVGALEAKVTVIGPAVEPRVREKVFDATESFQERPKPQLRTESVAVLLIAVQSVQPGAEPTFGAFPAGHASHPVVASSCDERVLPAGHATEIGIGTLLGVNRHCSRVRIVHAEGVSPSMKKLAAAFRHTLRGPGKDVPVESHE